MRYPEEVPVRMFDGSESIRGPITKFVEMGIHVSEEDEVQMIRLDVTKPCDADVVIGWEWMKEEGVVLDVREEVIRLPGRKKKEREKLEAGFGFKEGEVLGPRDSALEDELSEEEQEELLDSALMPFRQETWNFIRFEANVWFTSSCVLLRAVNSVLYAARREQSAVCYCTANYFTKLDLMGAYQLLRIAEVSRLRVDCGSKELPWELRGFSLWLVDLGDCLRY
ncbi:hypothetical protein TREMEDRAFT_60739 [Tremella mesenterica DSM 1558]|uniref:uncharacterized protein n=1 Tax=Tremella mesenterica (strain ATCC 24925 / CBS 8224 / DSM 1558 / NBRC 9311 / NRRL Y-6157 / RJB 2259-6 / UBC 559-6) TaxID=578456 RepID=UPI0003F4A50F|nr:uncharacterized protein TREMEDRAFT_60739 [Tremella mesenterica DSM 1558]EIW71821.1 hypothetical protein TREMEDRAFT_60739 [Tremella mesenterica DSM 1558]